VIIASQDGNDAFDQAIPVPRVVAITYAVIPKALRSFGDPDGRVKLRYRASAFGIAAASVVVRRNGKPIARLHRGAAEVEPGAVYSIPWSAPRAATGGALRFCVTLQNRTPGAPKRSFTSCAPIRLGGLVSRPR
jgi:hypothetical protein